MSWEYHDSDGWKHLCSNVDFRVKIIPRQNFCERLEECLPKKAFKTFYHLLWDNIGEINGMAITLATLCVIKQEKYSFQQVNLLFHQFPQDHLRPSQLLLHLLTWASQKRVTPIKIERCPLPSGQRGSPESGKEAPSLLRPWEPTSPLPWATAASGPSAWTACLVSLLYSCWKKLPGPLGRAASERRVGEEE